MESSWKQISLGELQNSNLAKIQTGPFGTVLKASEYTTDGVPVISVSEIREGFLRISSHTPRVNKEITNRLPIYILEEGDIVFGRKGAIDRNSIINKEQAGWFLGSDGIRLRLSEEINSTFVSYQLRSKAIGAWLLKNSAGSIMPSLNQKILDRLHLWLPELKIQNRIASFLRMTDEKIELNNKINSELETMVKTLYDYWFVQFEFKDRNDKPYKHSGGKMVWNEIIKREIPIGWKLEKLSTVVSWISGAQPSKSTFKYQEQEGYVRFIQNRDYASNKYKTYIAIGQNNKLCNEFDIMIDKYGDAGTVRFGLSGAYNVALSKIDVNIKNGQEYIRNYLRSDSVLSYLKGACIASTRASLNSENLESLHVLIPQENVLEKFEIMSKDFIKQILRNNKETQELTELRDWLLPMLMNGQVKVN